MCLGDTCGGVLTCVAIYQYVVLGACFHMCVDTPVAV